ncbi:fluoride efflux transporter CrcB [Natrialba sp. PRR66]|uniref:fluoride efflux transporter CrcB n=1 Tax=Natrialba sp. PRR66 TaxID=3098146 RepID=UPI002B1D4AA9|nr:fluoride efflux transporter CrcB [Natrialba sp. PRR66]
MLPLVTRSVLRVSFSVDGSHCESGVGLVIEPVLLVGVGGAVGALGRYTVATIVEGGRFPISTFLVNVIGSFLLGLVLFADPGESIQLFAGVGVCGGFTTFSTFSVDTVRLIEDGHVRTAVAYALGNVVVSVAAIGVAWFLV